MGLKQLFAAMQASKWSPDGEARPLLIKQRLSHASMSIGDAVQIGAELFVAGLAGFVQIHDGVRLLPANFDPDDVELEDDEEQEEENDEEEGYEPSEQRTQPHENGK